MHGEDIFCRKRDSDKGSPTLGDFEALSGTIILALSNDEMVSMEESVGMGVRPKLRMRSMVPSSGPWPLS